jgi:hypothetical protein
MPSDVLQPPVESSPAGATAVILRRIIGRVVGLP